MKTWTKNLYKMPPTVNDLWQSGLLKLFWTSPMRSNVFLLEFLINYWDHDLGMFDLQGKFLEVTSEDVYSIFGLSRRGALVNLEVPTEAMTF